MSLATALEPAVSLMNRLRYAQKFIFMGSALGTLVVFVVVTLVLEVLHDIRDTDQEVDGVGMIVPLNGVAHAIQSHRGFADGALAGNESMRARLGGAASEVQSGLAAVEQRLWPTLRETAAWQRIRMDWSALERDALSVGAEASFARHTELVERVHDFMIAVADATKLTLDPQLSTHYLVSVVSERAPAATEAIAQVRGRGMTALVKKALDGDAKLELAATNAAMRQAVRALRADLDKALTAVPELQAALGERTSRLFAAVDDLGAQVARDLLGGAFATSPDAFFDACSRIIDDANALTVHELEPKLQALLEARAAAGRGTLWWSIGATVGLGALLLYLSLGLYLSIRRGVAVLTQGAHAVEEGDLTAHFTSQGRDEIAYAASKFEVMVVRLREAVAGVRAEAESMTSVSVELASTSNQLASSSGRTRELALTASSATESATRDSEEVARGHEELGTAAREVAANAQKASTIASEAVTLGDTAQVRMKSLQAASGSIISVIQTVDQIAAKTNLLALNASIECVHAGEHGRAFAVVANQVKELARQSSQAARQIASDIERVQQEVVHVTDAIAQIGSTLKSINEYQSSTAAAIEEQRATIDALTATLHRVASAGTQTLESARAVADTMDDAASATRGVAASASTLNRLTNRVRERLGHFRVG